MLWTIPGTTLQIQKEDACRVDGLFQSMFMAGGMVLSQVACITGVEPYTIQNWVKRGLLTSPVHKRYSMNQLCRIIHINMLKSILPMEQICGLLSYVNGQLDDESDDIIDASQLYFLFVGLSAQVKQLNEPTERDRIISQALADYEEPLPGAKERITKALQIMLTAWVAALLRQKAEEMIANL